VSRKIWSNPNLTDLRAESVQSDCQVAVYPILTLPARVGREACVYSNRMYATTALTITACIFSLVSPHVFAQLNTAAASVVFEISPTADHKETATTFLVEANGKAEWVTARHVFESVGYPAQTTAFIYQAGEWKALRVSVIYSSVYDLAVLHWPEMPEGAKGLPICGANDPVGFDTVLYFLGFPFGQSTDSVGATLPPTLPLVKRAWMAGSQNLGSKSHPMLVLDAINNYGFSGGPILRFSVAIQPFQACLVAVTLGFHAEPEPVISAGRKTEASVLYNTGLMYGIPADGITELLGKPEQLPTK
jgi:hypothetical protein